MELELYNSFEEENTSCCIFCKRDTNNPLKLGNKVTIGETTAHHFCLASQIILKIESIYHDYSNLIEAPQCTI